MKPVYRQRKEEDTNLILNSFLKEFRHSNLARGVESAVFYRQMKHIITHLLNTKNTIIICSEDDPDLIYGYCIFEYDPINTPIFHWIYVKSAYRKSKLATNLITLIAPNILKDTTFSTFSMPVIEQIIKSKSIPNIYNPFLNFKGAII